MRGAKSLHENLIRNDVKKKKKKKKKRTCKKKKDREKEGKGNTMNLCCKANPSELSGKH